MAYTTEVLADAPLAYYRLGESTGTTLTDSSGNNRTGIYGDTANLVYGRPSLIATDSSNTAVQFGGSTDARGEVTSATWLQPTALTVEAWIRPTTVTGNGEIVGRGSSTLAANAAFSWRLVRIGSALFGRVYVNGSTTTASAQSANGVLAIGTVAHVAMTFDNATITLYVNGLQVATAARTGTLNPGSYPLVIGTSCTTSATIYGSPFGGDIDEVAVYGTALSSSRIEQHVMAGTGIAPSARLSRLHTETLLAVIPAVNVSRTHMELLIASVPPPINVSRLHIEVLYQSGPTIQWWDGTTRRTAYINGWWDGEVVRPIKLNGWYDGNSTRPLK